MEATHGIGDRLRDVRKRRGLTQRELAQLSDVSLSVIRKLEQNDYGNVIELAISDAGDDLTEMAAADWKCWALLRQGRLAETTELAIRWADATEPRMSSATPAELTVWGRFLILVSTAAVRDNRPGEAADALRLARWRRRD